MSKAPKPGNEIRAQVRRYRASLVRGPHRYVPPQLWYRGREITHAREMARHLRQIAEGKLKP